MILIWFFFGMIGLIIGLSKGINPLLAILGGVLLGPFSILMLFISTDSKKCPRCAEGVKKEALVCRHCGLDFSTGCRPSEGVQCPKCARLIKVGSKYCTYCGAEFSPPAPHEG